MLTQHTFYNQNRFIKSCYQNCNVNNSFDPEIDLDFVHKKFLKNELYFYHHCEPYIKHLRFFVAYSKCKTSIQLRIYKRILYFDCTAFLLN